MTAPTKEQLDRYMDLVVGGEEAEDAIAVIWADEPAPKAQPKPVIMVTEFPDGVVIGWDTCSGANGGCSKVVAKCACKGGPRSLKVFEKWLALPDTRPDYGNPTRYAGPAETAPTTVVVSEPSAPSSGSRIAAATPANSVPCREGKHFAPIGEADRNDDGTYTCHACQEAGVQVERADA